MLTHQTSPAAPSRVVLLGAQGFLASRLRAALEQARTPVHAIGSRDVDLTAPGATTALASTLREGDSIVFLSAITPDKGKGIDALMANLRMAEQVCTALAEVGSGYRLAPTRHGTQSNPTLGPGRYLDEAGYSIVSASRPTRSMVILPTGGSPRFLR